MKRYIISIAASAAILGILLYFVPLEDVRQIPLQIGPIGIAVGIALYILSYLIVSLRWRLLFRDICPERTNLRLGDLVAVTALHNFINNFLPARAGDVSVVYLAKKHLGVSAPGGMTSLILARAMDFSALGLLALVFAIVQGQGSIAARNYVFTTAVFFLIAPVVGVIVMRRWGKTASEFFARIGGGESREKGLPSRTFRFVGTSALRLSEKRQTSFYLKLFAFSVAIMLVRVAIFSSFLIWAVEPVAPVSAAIIGLSCLVVSSTPIQGFLALGAFEGGWVLGYALLGLSTEEALLTAFNAHLIILLTLVFMAFIGNLWLTRKSRETKA